MVGPRPPRTPNAVTAGKFHAGFLMTVSKKSQDGTERH